jgi:hypothetical protein
MSGEQEDQAPQGAATDMSAEQGADFAALMAGADAPEAEQAAKVEAEQAGDMAAMIQENAQLLEVVWDIAGGLLPEKVAARYGPDQRARIAASGTALAVKRGWSAAEFMAAWGVEIAFGAALVGPVVPVVLEAIKNRSKGAPDPTAPAQVEPPRPPVQADQEPGAKTVTIGTVIP